MCHFDDLEEKDLLWVDEFTGERAYSGRKLFNLTDQVSATLQNLFSSCGLSRVGWVANEILETVQSPNSSFLILF